MSIHTRQHHQELNSALPLILRPNCVQLRGCNIDQHESR